MKYKGKSAKQAMEPENNNYSLAWTDKQVGLLLSVKVKRKEQKAFIIKAVTSPHVIKAVFHAHTDMQSL